MKEVIDSREMVLLCSLVVQNKNSIFDFDEEIKK